MSLLKQLIESQGGALVRQLANDHGIDERQVTGALGQLLPALSGGLKARASADGGDLDGLLGALTRGDHRQFAENPQALAGHDAIDQGNAILGQLLGSKDTSRAVAAQVAGNTGIDVGAVKKMLPQVAAMAMGALASQSNAGGASTGIDALRSGLGQAAGGQRQQALGGLASLLDADGDGSVADDLFGMAKRFL
ncbi:MAG: DUF937 domain-containing protein [Pseudomonadota bacterium]